MRTNKEIELYDELNISMFVRTHRMRWFRTYRKDGQYYNAKNGT